jgi:hypothetical protein
MSQELLPKPTHSRRMASSKILRSFVAWAASLVSVVLVMFFVHADPAQAYQPGCYSSHTHYISEAYTDVADYDKGPAQLRGWWRYWYSNNYDQDYGIYRNCPPI